MKNQEIIDNYYKEAVKGLNDLILQDKDLWYSYVINLPKNLQVVYTIAILHQQVLNGGLHQYFFNSYGQFSYLTVDNLKLVKALKTANILEKALSEVNIEEYSEGEFREKVFNRKLDRIANFDEQLTEILEVLDDEYYSLDEDLQELIINHFKNHNNFSS
jgi:hypothetical protein